MKNLILVLLLLCANRAFGQTATPTAAHQQIPGTNISLVPPTDFTSSDKFKGFQNPDDPTSMIMVVEIPGPFDQVSAGFNAELMAGRGMILTAKDSAKVNDLDAWFIELEQDANGMTFTKTILIYGDAGTSTLINGISLKDSVALAQQIRNSVRSAFVDAAVVADPRAELAFTVDETAGGLQMIAVMGNSILLNRDGKTPTESEDLATFVIDRSFEDQAIIDQRAFCTRRLAMLPGNYELVSGEYPRKTSLAGLDGYELLAVDADDEEELYMTILFEEDGGYYLLIGMYRVGAEKAKADIDAVRKTFLPR